MFLCSVASELSSYDSLSFGAFLRINTVVILRGDVIRGNPWVVEGVRPPKSARPPFPGRPQSSLQNQHYAGCLNFCEHICSVE